MRHIFLHPLTTLAFSLLMFASVARAAPTISNVSGTVANGQQITITGAGFGSSGPNVLLFDDFEKGTNGSTIMTGTGSAEIGQWAYGGSPPDTAGMLYTNTSKVSGNLSFLANYTSDGQNALQVTPPSGTTEYFLTYWVYVPSTYNGQTNQWPGQSQNLTNWKIIWSNCGDPGWTTEIDDLTTPTMQGPSNAECGSDTIPGQPAWWLTLNFPTGKWTRFTVWVNGGTPGTATGTVSVWTLNSTHPWSHAGGTTNSEILQSGSTYKAINVNAYGRSGASSGDVSVVQFDDVYIATGSAAQARVEIGNASTYSACTDMAMITPTSWSDSSITGTVRQGSFGNGAAYLYVTDSTGATNAAGYPVTIGVTSSSSQLPAVNGLHLIQ